jgi:hypothetical protein
LDNCRTMLYVLRTTTPFIIRSNCTHDACCVGPCLAGGMPNACTSAPTSKLSLGSILMGLIDRERNALGCSSARSRVRSTLTTSAVVISPLASFPSGSIGLKITLTCLLPPTTCQFVNIAPSSSSEPEPIPSLVTIRTTAGAASRKIAIFRARRVVRSFVLYSFRNAEPAAIVEPMSAPDISITGVSLLENDLGSPGIGSTRSRRSNTNPLSG